MKHNEEGFILVAIIWIIAILTVLTLGLANRALLDQRAAALALDHAQTQFLARGAVQYAVADMRNKAVTEAILLQAREQAAAQGIPTSFRADSVDPARGGKRIVSLSDQSEIFTPSSNDSANTIGYSVSDAEARISLNTATEELLDEIEGLSFSTVSAIMRYRGGELTPEERHQFLSVEEGRFLEGVDEDDWEGSDGKPGLRELFTIYGEGRINLNSAPRDVLLAVPDLDDDVVDAIIAYREGDDNKLNTSDDRSFRNLESIPAALGVDPTDLAPVAQYCTLQSQFFTITGFAAKRQGKVRAAAKAVVHLQPGNAAILSWSEGELGP
ncbi:MAG: hypothetical protein SGI88_15140 [Candidatus Hydrogenedentes bacterium]|nr:hypothetical protein [Candidatus Hydrogenedentota bacterium]